jgi:hypothetical protein
MRLVYLLVLLLSVIASTTFGSDITSDEEWMGIYSGNDKIGYSHTIIKTDEGKLGIIEETNLRMTILGTNQDVRVNSNYILDGYKLQAFDFSMNAGSVDLRAEGKREGKELKIEMFSVSGKTDISFPLAGEPLVPPILFKWLSRQKPKVGKSYEVTLFDPTPILTGAENLKATLSIEGEEQIRVPIGDFKTYRVKMVFMGSQSTTWITEEGKIIKEVSPPGLIAVREAKENILGEDLKSLDIIERTAISSNVSLDNARALKLLRVKIDGIDTKGFDLQDNNRQFFEDGMVEVRQNDLSRVNSYAIPYSGEEYKSYTKSSSLIQSDDPKVAEKSREILKGEKNSLQAAKEINSWVYKNLEKIPTVSLPNALDVLKTRKGDCNEHATLFAALSRAAGIPTKIVLGVVHLDGKFYYHAWNEVFVGSWVALDPTFGQFPADASHIKFVEGDLSRSPEIIRLVGKIKLEIRDAL